jgi:anthranilate 1,2-dioxygenase small subunit/terephthalate 1,2-dioxygenase oxygenase component beta subunit
MLKDRVLALREANIYERQRYRHLIGLPSIVAEQADGAAVESPFLVVRIMRDGHMDVFATGRYLDRVARDPSGTLRLRERIVVCDGQRFDTLLALPL